VDDAEAELANQDQQIDWLMNKLKLDNANRPKKVIDLFKVQKGDMLDELLGAYINENGCPVPIKRLGNGYYMFGSRKIYAKVLNGKLVIRVGGGYMIINEFIANYAEAELRKMEHNQNKADEQAAAAALLNAETKKKKGKGDTTTTTTEKTYDAKYDIGLAGSMHEKKFTQGYLDKIRNNPRAMRVLGD